MYFYIVIVNIIRKFKPALYPLLNIYQISKIDECLNYFSFFSDQVH
jgi:hypothetical protein